MSIYLGYLRMLRAGPGIDAIDRGRVETATAVIVALSRSHASLCEGDPNPGVAGRSTEDASALAKIRRARPIFSWSLILPPLVKAL